MTDLEALMWHLEQDPQLASTFGNVTILDREPDVERFRARLGAAVAAVPRLRQRVVAPFGRLTPPSWIDTDVDLEQHVPVITMLAPGSDRQLLDLAVRLVSEPLDTGRPLWRFVVVRGLEGGRAAIIQHVHHAVMDGEGGARVSVSFIDFERDPNEEEPARREHPSLAAPEQPPSSAAALADAVGHTMRRGAGMAQRTLAGLAGVAARPDRWPRTATAAVRATRSLARQAIVLDRARSPLWTARSDNRALEVVRVPLDDARRTAKDLGGSVNDLFVTAVTGGLGRYHRARGVDPPLLRMAMPVSTRQRGSAESNAFGTTRTLVPLTADPIARFEDVKDRLAAVRVPAGLRVMAGASAVAGLLPFGVLARIAKTQTATVDFVTSNVRGAPVDLYIAGARMEANYPIGPLAGTALNCTLLSASGRLDMGLHVDTAAIPDPEALRDDIEAAWRELLEVAG